LKRRKVGANLRYLLPAIQHLVSIGAKIAMMRRLRGSGAAIALCS
jgi:hypothetical protein